MFRNIFLITVSLVLTGNLLYGQKIQDFLNSYNSHLDPYHRLDSIHYMSVRKNLKVTLNDGNELLTTSICHYCSSGIEKCINISNGISLDMSPIQIPSSFRSNVILFELNFLKNSPDVDTAFFVSINDSVTVIEKLSNEINERTVYTFDTSSKNLLQIKSLNKLKKEMGDRYINFVEYQTIEGILVPKTIRYTNSFCVAILEYEDIIFKPFCDLND